MGQHTQIVRKTIADRPIVRGYPVPWVARWSEEISSEAFTVGADKHGNQFIAYNPELPWDRDQRGVLWMREDPLANGRGTPGFTEFSSYRQRVCMEEKRCQVCGSHIEGPLFWIMTEHQLMLFNHFKNVTENPPLCEPCVSESKLWCPHIKQSSHQIWKVDKTTPVGYMGEIAYYQENGTLFRKQALPVSFITDPKILRCFMARQLSVHIADADYEVIQNV